MASIYECPPFYKVEKKWDDNVTLSEVYKLQSNNPQNKSRVEIHKDNGGYSIIFTVDKTISELVKGQKSVRLLYGVRKCAPRTAQDCLEADAP